MRNIRRYPKQVKEQALNYRREGLTYKEILAKLPEYNIPKNTLSDWCTKARISLTAAQQGRILKYQMTKLYEAQKKGSEWQRKEKQKRLIVAKVDAENFLKNYPPNKTSHFYFLSGLYLGEGGKDDLRVLFANSNPSIIKCFLKIFREMFSPSEKRISVELHTRYDQDKNKIIKFWSQITSIPQEQFRKVQADKRTKSSSTYGDYHGVCAICYSDAKIQRFLLELQQQYICSILKE